MSASQRHNPWRARLALLIGLSLLLSMAAHSVWAAPHQLPARQTVPTRTHTLAPSATATQTPDPTATFTPTRVPPTQVQPTQPAPTQPAPTQPPPTQQPAATQAQPTAAPASPVPTPTSAPSPQPNVLFPVAGNDWSDPLRRNGALALAVLAIAFVAGALTFARPTPRGPRER